MNGDRPRWREHPVARPIGGRWGIIRTMIDRKDIRVRVTRRTEADRRDVANLTPAERMGMVWQLTRDAWAFKGEPERVESPFQRHVVRIHRGGR